MWNLLKQTGSNWLEHKDARLGAALAYYSIFSVGPLILIATAVAGLWFGEDAVRGQVGAQIEDVLGSSGAQVVQSMLAGAARPRAACSQQPSGSLPCCLRRSASSFSSRMPSTRSGASSRRKAASGSSCELTLYRSPAFFHSGFYCWCLFS